MASKTASISAEFTFVLSCAGSAGSVAVPAGLDDAVLGAIAYRHQVVPLVIAALRDAGSPVPATLAARHDPVAMLRSAREAVRIHALLAQAGVAVVFLKGSTLAMLAYGALDRRQFGDIDLLVDAGAAARAAVLLGEAGYRAEYGAPCETAAIVSRHLLLGKDIVLRHPASGQVVELHWRLTDNPRQRVLEQDRQWVELAPGAALPTLGMESLFTYLCVHGTAHCWARLRWLADVAALIGRAPDGGDHLWRGAVARGQARAAASAILLCAELFGTAAPPSFARPASLRLALLLALARRVIGAGGGTVELARTGWRGWAEMAAKLLVASSVGDLAGWGMRVIMSPADDRTGRSRFWYLHHPLQRIPGLIRRRRSRRRRDGETA